MPSKRGRRSRRKHTYRRPEPVHGTKARGHHHCTYCSKWCYTTRREAEKSVAVIHPGATVHYYQCPGAPEWWHYTSLPADEVARIRARRAVIPPEPEELAS